MVIVADKLVHFLKSPFKLDDHDPSVDASLRVFRSKTSGILSQSGGDGSPEMKPVAWFNNCFEMMHAAHNAFANLVVEIEYPMNQWGAAAMHDYLSYTLSLMDMLNSISSSVSHLKLLKISMLHGSSHVQNSPKSAAMHLKKIWSNNLGGDLKVERSPTIDIRPGSDHKEHVILEALMVLKKIGFSALGLVVSGLCSHEKIQSFVEEVNRVGELKGRLEVMENAIQGIEKQANDLFFEVLATRNKLIDNIRFAASKS